MFQDNTGARSGQEHRHVCCSIPESEQWDLWSASAKVPQQSQLALHQPAAVAADAGTACHQHEQWPECQDSCKAPGTCTRCISPLYATQNQACKLIMWWECICACMAGSLAERCGSEPGSCMQSQPQQYCGSDRTHMHSNAPSSRPCSADSEHRTQHAS